VPVAGKPKLEWLQSGNPTYRFGSTAFVAGSLANGWKRDQADANDVSSLDVR